VSRSPTIGLDAQKKQLRASEQDPQRRAAWWLAMLAIDPQRLVFVDETGNNISGTPRYGRAPCGQRCIGQVPRNWGKNTTLIAAMTLEGIQTAAVIEGSMDRPVFERFVEQFLVPSLRPGQLVVWDNLSVHKSVRARQLVAAAGCQVVFLPPYSPDFNPIELAFSKLKSAVRRAKQRTVAGLWEAIGSGLTQITARDAYGWFQHCGYRLHQQLL
jgi:transposase